MIEEELLERESEARTQFVVAQFERIGLDIRAYPELFERFRQLHDRESEHFRDSVQMAEIVDVIWDELEAKLPFKLDKNRLALTALLHDVGKSGPKEATSEEQQLIVTLFNSNHYSDIRKTGKRIEDMALIDVLRGSDIEIGLQQRIVNYLRKLGINFETEKMIDFWRRHADWTYEILASARDGIITSELAAAAASHHVLDGKNPAGLDLKNIPGEAKTIEIIETYEVLTLVDKFQAFIKRGGLNHGEAVQVLRQIIDGQSLPEGVKDDYRIILAVIEGSADKIQKVLKPSL